MKIVLSVIIALIIIAGASSTAPIFATNVAQSQSDKFRTVTPKHHSLVIEPEFTEAAYQSGGWYDNRQVTTVSLQFDEYWRTDFGGSQNGFKVLNATGLVDTTTDLEVSQHPDILKAYDRVILLHNEYVTKTEYDAIIGHPNVFYAYPNALYRFVSFKVGNSTAADGGAGSISLIGPTDNPYSKSRWGYVSEFDRCVQHEYQVVRYLNGIGLSCYPEGILEGDSELIDIVVGKQMPDGEGSGDNLLPSRLMMYVSQTAEHIHIAHKGENLKITGDYKLDTKYTLTTSGIATFASDLPVIYNAHIILGLSTWKTTGRVVSMDVMGGMVTLGNETRKVHAGQVYVMNGHLAYIFATMTPAENPGLGSAQVLKLRAVLPADNGKLPVVSSDPPLKMDAQGHFQSGGQWFLKTSGQVALSSQLDQVLLLLQVDSLSNSPSFGHRT